MKASRRRVISHAGAVASASRSAVARSAVVRSAVARSAVARSAVVLSAVVLSAVALVPCRTAMAQQKVDERHAVAGDVSFRVTGSIGTLRITGWAKDSLVITGALPAGVRMEMAVGYSGATPARGAKMYIESPNDVVASGGTLEIRVPSRARVWVKSGTADVEVREVSGGVDVNVIGGKVHVAASPRELQIEAMDAGVVIEGSPTWLRAKTASGDLTLRGGSTDLALTSVSGAVRVEGGTVERGRVETVTGAIWFASAPAGAGDLTFDSHSGAIDLRLPSPGGFTLTASSITGTVDNQFDATRPSKGREGRGAELSLQRGNESARITVRAFKGTVTVRR